MKRSAAVILLALGVWGFIAYWTSTNDCDRKVTALNNPMKAIVQCEYGPPDVLKLEEVEKPVPGDNQVLIKVRAASLNFIDAGIMEANPASPDGDRAQTNEDDARTRCGRPG